ncbi:MAG: hypothetical protein GY953_18395 [bacterium]|nr:hypothetical protein [bacterium]
MRQTVRQLLRLFNRRVILDGHRVEDDDIGEPAGLKGATVHQMEIDAGCDARRRMASCNGIKPSSRTEAHPGVTDAASVLLSGRQVLRRPYRGLG